MDNDTQPLWWRARGNSFPCFGDRRERRATSADASVDCVRVHGGHGSSTRFNGKVGHEIALSGLRGRAYAGAGVGWLAVRLVRIC